jgi:hypothetical protein
MEDNVVRGKKLTVFLTILILMSAITGAQEAQKSELVNVSFQKAETQIEVLIQCNIPISYKSFVLLNPNRLVIDIPQIDTISAPPSLEVNDFGIAQIDTGTPEIGTARVVVRFIENIMNYRLEEMENGLKIIITQKEGEPEAVTPVTKVEEKPVQEKPPVQKVETKEKPPVQEAKVKPAAQKAVAKKVKEKPADDSRRFRDMTIAVTPGFFFMQDGTFSETYEDFMFGVRAEMSVVLPIPVPDCIDFWSSVRYMEKTGTSTYFEEELKLSFTQFSFALRYLKKIGRFTPFVGLGADYTSYKETYPEDFVIPSVGGNDLGFHMQTGVYIEIFPCLSGKVHIKYNIGRTVENDVEVNLGGIEYGFGFAVHFNL